MIDLSDFQLVQVAKMHFENGMAQKEIAVCLGLSNMTVSRMLQKARETEIVQIVVRLPFELGSRLADALVSAYPIERAVVVKGACGRIEELRSLIGGVTAFYLTMEKIDHQVLGMGVGATIGQVVQHLLPMKTKDLHIVQLMGGLSDVSDSNPFSIVQETCRRLHAKGTYLTSNALVENAEYCRHLMFETPMGMETQSLWKGCTKAVFGVGSIESGTLLSETLVGPEELENVKKQGAVGDILGHCFDKAGKFVQTELEDRLVSIPVSSLMQIEERYGVAGGVNKVGAIRGALNSGLIKTLITDEKTASQLVEGFSGERAQAAKERR